MMHIIEVILSWLFPVYWEVAITKKNGENTYLSFSSQHDAEYYAENMMAADTGQISHVTIDKFINAHPNFLIKVNSTHQGYWVNNR